jgi:hypothetical protein
VAIKNGKVLKAKKQKEEDEGKRLEEVERTKNSSPILSYVFKSASGPNK